MRMSDAEKNERFNIVRRIAIDVFEIEEYADSWMRNPNPALGNVPPIDLLDTERGLRSVLQVLNSISTGGVL